MFLFAAIFQIIISNKIHVYFKILLKLYELFKKAMLDLIETSLHKNLNLYKKFYEILDPSTKTEL